MIGLSAAIIWQLLHTPSAKVSQRWKKTENCSASSGLNSTERAQPSPVPSVNAIREAAAGNQTAELLEARAARPAVACARRRCLSRLRHRVVYLDMELTLLAQDRHLRTGLRDEGRGESPLASKLARHAGRCPGVPAAACRCRRRPARRAAH